MKDFTMVVPSYWGRAGEEPIEKIVFDHPTPLNERGTLPLLLDSLDVLRGMDGTVTIVAVANDPAIADEVEEKVEALIAPYRERYDIRCLGQSALDVLCERLADDGVSRAALALLNLDNAYQATMRSGMAAMKNMMT